MKVNGRDYRTVWLEGTVVKMINQPLIPHRFEIVDMPTHVDTANAISVMTVRGAGAIGAAAGFGMAQVVLEAPEDDFDAYVQRGYDTLRSTRPTAQDLFYAIDRVKSAAQGKPPAQARREARREAQAIADEGAEAGRRIGQNGAELLKDGDVVLTHCNAGWLAFVDWGSALSPVYVARRQGKNVTVMADETRPRCQGSRLTAWELAQEGVPVKIIADNAAGFFLSRGEISICIVGADRIARNGDVANKIGTYEKAVLAARHGVPFYVAAPLSTFDVNCADGADIPIEERDQDEVLFACGWTDEGCRGRVRVSPVDAQARNPAFDVTPAELVAGIITEKGVIGANESEISRLLGAS